MASPVLQFDNVDMAPSTDYGPGLAGLSFVLGAGELAFVRTSRQGRFPPLADLAEGLLPPDRGRVVFAGEDWTKLTPDQAAARRGQIGRVFHGPAWVNNLDVDENVTLRMRQHSGRKAADVQSAATEIGRRFGLPELPHGRPAWVSHEDLIRAQWVRALLGAPRLLILEDSEHEAPEQTLAAWRAAVAEAIREGAAALWIGPELPGSLAPQHRFEIRGASMERVEERKT